MGRRAEPVASGGDEGRLARRDHRPRGHDPACAQAPGHDHDDPVAATGIVISGTNYKVGIATWYNYTPGDCATWYLPKGTRITVRDLITGRTITCVITDREAHEYNHVVDLSESQFSQLEPLWRGVISVKVSW